MPPTVDPAAAPNTAITISCEWLPFIRGALLQLVLQATWKVPNDAALLLAQQRAMTLIAMFDECSGSSLPFACPYAFDTSDGGWTNLVDGSLTPNHAGSYFGGLYWACTNTNYNPRGTDGLTRIDIHKTFSPAISANHITVEYNLAKGTFSDAGGWGNAIIASYLGAAQFSQVVLSASDPDGTHKTLSASHAPTLVDDVRIVITSAAVQGGVGNGTCQVLFAEVDGVGAAGC